MGMKIDRENPLPLQRQLYLALKDWFISDFSSDDILPSEMAISKQFEISQGTVRIALDLLVKEGLIVRTPGKGTFLNPDYKIKLTKYNLGVILSDADFFSNSIWEHDAMHYLEVINGIVGSNLSYNVTTEFISEDFYTEELDKTYDGYILWPFIQDSVRRSLKQPFVELKNSIDIEDGFRKIAKHIVSKKYKKAGYIGFTSLDRLKTVNSILEDSIIGPISDSQYVECGGSSDEAYRSCIKLLQINPDTDCIICSTDMRAHGVLKYLESIGKQVPEDIAVYGFDGTRNNRRITPSITTVIFEWKSLGAFAVKQLRNILDGVETEEFKPARGTLVLQDSTFR